MIYNYPYFGFPNYLNYVSKKPYINSSFSNNKNFETFHKTNRNLNYYNSSTEHNNKNSYNNSFNNNSNAEQKKSNKTTETSYSPFLNLFGIQLYFDDILLICIILFLYNEKIDDNYLLLSLVLLLLG